jgi:ASC-1-like (ASCH) protein
MPGQTKTRLPWGQDTITRKGRNSGLQDITVHFDGETLNIVDFLNHSLKADYAAIYEEIMSRYEAKLKSGGIFDHNFPEAKITCKEIDTAQYETTNPIKDNELIEALLKEYHVCLDDLKTRFKHYEAHVERWYSSLPVEEKRV